ncbi:MAG: hypothetical protein DRJ05_06980 [Bacteroidetes bacterium]|nr:MAG: hypothetical protein DRJ05_06980 [Bacteroidota bacterium]
MCGFSRTLVFFYNFLDWIHNKVLDTGNLSPGIYLCKIQTGNFTIIKRIILAR